MIKTIFTTLISEVSKIPWGIVKQVFDAAPAIIKDVETVGGTGWDKLQAAVNDIQAKIPALKEYAGIASTVVTIIVTIVRLVDVLKK